VTGAAPQWRRLSPRMLLIHPVREVGRAVPALAGVLLAGRNSGHEWWSLAALVLVVGLSMLRWLTTGYLITEHQVQLRTGLFRRRTVTTPLDRVRTVDVTAHALHRVLGLARVAIGTGTSDRKREPLVLDGLPAPAAGALRAELLHRAAAVAPGVTAAGGGPDRSQQVAAGAAWSQPAAEGPEWSQPAAPPEEEVIARLDPRWIWYAPFTLSGAVTGLAVLGLLWRVLSQAEVPAGRIPVLRWGGRHLARTAVWADVLQVAVAVLVLVGLLSVIGYLLAFWNFRLTRHPGGSLQVQRGLVTSRATSISERRLRGVELSQLLPLRLVGGARLLAVATGLRMRRGAERGGTLLLPASPVTETRRVAAAVLAGAPPAGAGGTPLAEPLRPHGPAARRRRYQRAVLPAGTVLLGLLVLWLAGVVPAWLPVVGLLLPVLAVPLARDRYAALGHELAGRFLVIRSGSLDRRQVVLATDGIIGWRLQQSPFQRRAGLVTATATTAAGRQGYRIQDVRYGEAMRLIEAVDPALLATLEPEPS